MESAPPRSALLFGRDAVGTGRVQVPERQRVSQRAGDCRGREASRLTTRLPPESDASNREGDQHHQSDGAEQRDHHAMRNDAVEIGLDARLSQNAGRRQPRAGQEEGSHRSRERQCARSAVTAKSRRKPARPRTLLVRPRPDPRHRSRHVDPELVRRRELARVQTFAAVVAQARQVDEVLLLEDETLLDCREHGAELLAIAARVAHARDVGAVEEQIIHGHAAQPPPRRSGRTPCRSSSRSRRGTRAAGCCPP